VSEKKGCTGCMKLRFERIYLSFKSHYIGLRHYGVEVFKEADGTYAATIRLENFAIRLG
jgi:hypothetical protein